MTALRPLPLLLAFSAFAHAAIAAEPPGTGPATVTPKKPGGTSWVFSLIPNAFQKNPRLNMTLITEVSEAGRQRPPASRDAPVYYTARSGGYRAFGDSQSRLPFSADDASRLLASSLKSAGYLPADATHPATLFIVYVWGAHNLPDLDTGAVTAAQLAANILDRAALAGGEKFAADLGRAMALSDAASSATAPALGAAAQSSGMDLGAAAGLAVVSAGADPVRVFRLAAPKNSFLVDHVASDLYYVVASAYDFASLANPPRVLLWRTRMTVNAAGVSQADSLPALIAAATPFFGRDMQEPEVLSKLAVREGQVDVGSPSVVPPEKN